MSNPSAGRSRSSPARKSTFRASPSAPGTVRKAEWRSPQRHHSHTTYAIELSDRGSAFLIIAPHGGWIEPGTTEVAKAIAGADLSYYSFSGLKRDRPHGDLHVTSECFDEPRALELITKATYVVAIHGMKDKPEGDDVWIGGRGTALKRAAFDAITSLGFSARIRRPGETLAGLTTENICNKGLSKSGLQLEISRSLRDRIRAEPPLLIEFSECLKRAF